MSYDLAVWVGPTPLSAAEADEEFARRMDARDQNLETGGDPRPPTPEIGKFVELAVARFPEHEDEAPWASSPLIGDAIGDVIYFSMTFSGAEYARDELADIASSLKLICYDPQAECVLPNEEATSASEIRSKADAALLEYASGDARLTGRQGWVRRILRRQ